MYFQRKWWLFNANGLKTCIPHIIWLVVLDDHNPLYITFSNQIVGETDWQLYYVYKWTGFQK